MFAYSIMESALHLRVKFFIWLFLLKFVEASEFPLVTGILLEAYVFQIFELNTV